MGSRHHQRDLVSAQGERGEEHESTRKPSGMGCDYCTGRTGLECGVGSLLFQSNNAWAQAEAEEARLLRAGACVVMLRHAQTDPGVGDPPDFRSGAVPHAAQPERAGPRPGPAYRRMVQVPQAPAARGSVQRLVPVQGHGRPGVRRTTLCCRRWGRPLAAAPHSLTRRRRCARCWRAVPPGQFDVWVTHQVNITAFTGENPSMGEAIIVGSGGRALLRTRFG